MRSRIEPMKKIARSLRQHRELILNYFRAQKLLSSGVVEGLNNKAKVTMRKSYGFRTFRCLELALYHSLGKLPEPESTTNSSDEPEKRDKKGILDPGCASYFNGDRRASRAIREGTGRRLTLQLVGKEIRFGHLPLTVASVRPPSLLMSSATYRARAGFAPLSSAVPKLRR